MNTFLKVYNITAHVLGHCVLAGFAGMVLFMTYISVSDNLSHKQQ